MYDRNIKFTKSIRRFVNVRDVVEVIQYLKDDNIGEVLEFCGDNISYDSDIDEYVLKTRVGKSILYRSDYIVKRNGEFLLLNASYFDEHYIEL